MTRDFHLKKVFTSLSFSLLPGQCTTPIKKVNSKSTKYLPSQLYYFPALNHHSSIYPSTSKNGTGVEKKGTGIHLRLILQSPPRKVSTSLPQNAAIPPPALQNMCLENLFTIPVKKQAELPDFSHLGAGFRSLALKTDRSMR